MKYTVQYDGRNVQTFDNQKDADTFVDKICIEWYAERKSNRVVFVLWPEENMELIGENNTKHVVKVIKEESAQ